MEIVCFVRKPYRNKHDVKTTNHKRNTEFWFEALIGCPGKPYNCSCRLLQLGVATHACTYTLDVL